MGRYSSVQAYADNNANARAVNYEQATGSAEPKKGTGTFRGAQRVQGDNERYPMIDPF